MNSQGSFVMRIRDRLHRLVPAGARTMLVSHGVRFLVLVVADVLVRLLLRGDGPGALVTVAKEFFRYSLAGYWVYCLTADLFMHLLVRNGRGDGPTVESSVLSDAPRIAVLTAGAAFILALGAVIGAKFQVSGSGPPWLPMLPLLAALIDAKIITDWAGSTSVFSARR